MKNLDFHLYDKLVEAAYGTAVDDGRWKELFRLMRQATDVEHFVIQGFDLSLGTKNIAALYGYDQWFSEAYEAHFWQKNPWLPGISKSPIGRSVAAELYCPEEHLKNTEFYNDLISKYDDVGSGGGIVLYRDDTRFLSIGGNIKMSHRDTMQTGWLDLLNILSPHLRNAFEMRRKLSGKKVTDSGYAGVIDAIGNPVYLLSSSGQIAHANSAGLDLLGSDIGLGLSPFNALTFNDPRSNRLLSTFLGQMSGGRLTVDTRQFEIRSTEGNPVALATLSPFCPDPGQVDLFADFGPHDTPVAILAVATTKADSAIDPGRLEQFFGLTPTEAKLAAALASGRSLYDYADERQISRHTARNQLSSVYAKTNTNRQSQLVALINQIS